MKYPSLPQIRRVVPTLAIACLAWTAALATPVQTTIEYPPNNATNVRANPTVFFSVFQDPAAPLATQEDFEVQIATSSNFAPGTIVWQSHPGSGAGMAVSIDEQSGTFQGALSCELRLAFGTVYYVRARQKTVGGGYGPYSTTPSRFTTVTYDGVLRHVATSGTDTGGCTNPSAPCRTLSYAVNRSIPGDQIEIRPGVYTMGEGALSFNNMPDRVWIRGSDPQNRPIFRANYAPNGVSIFATFNGADDVIFQDLVFEGTSTCCPAGTQNRYAILLRGQPKRTSWQGVTFRNGMHISGNLDPANQGTTDLLFADVEILAQPTDGVVPGYLDLGRTETCFADYKVSRLTMRRSTFDQCTDHMVLAHVDRALFEDVDLTRGAIHPMRTLGVSRNWTMRRILVGDGPEGLSFSAGDASGPAGAGASSVVNLSVEDSTFLHSLTISDNAAVPGTIGYLVLRNNIWAGGGSPLLWIEDCIVFCPGGDLINTGSDRIDIDHNIYWRSDPLASLIRFDGTTYTRRGSPNYDAWLARGFDAGAPFQLYNVASKDTVDPRLTRVPRNDPSLEADPTPLPGSPAIEAGEPSYFVPPGGGNRDDIGQVEVPIAPVISGSNPLDGDTCASESYQAVTVLVEDGQEAIDMGSFQVTVDAQSVQPTVSGSGSAVSLTIPLLGSLEVTMVTVAAADTATPPHATQKTLCYRTQPPTPTGVFID